MTGISSGQIEATGDEMLLVPIVIKGLSVGSKVIKSVMSIELGVSLEEQAINISEKIGKSTIDIGYGRLDLQGEAHVIKLGGGEKLKISTPHVKPYMFNYSPPTPENPLGFFHMKTVRNLTRSATQEDLIRATKIINSQF